MVTHLRFNMRAPAIIILLTLFCGSVFSQSKREVDSLLSEVCSTKDSKNIIKSGPAKKLIAYGTKLLPVLTDFFNDTTLTKVTSSCQGRFLSKGEVAIILADKIESMPYYIVTGVQNCLMTFCENNPNRIEFYLYAIKHHGVALFSKKYTAWLNSDDRKKWHPYITNKIPRKAKTT